MVGRSVRGRLVLLALVVLLLYPFEWQVVPAWRLCVVDEEGKPMANLRASLWWFHYSLQWSCEGEGYEVKRTDESGCVSFSEKKMRASLVQWALVSGLQLLALPHSSWGPSGFMVLSGYDSNEYIADPHWLSYDGDKAPPERVVIRKRRPQQAESTGSESQ